MRHSKHLSLPAILLLIASFAYGQQEIIPDQGSCDCKGRKQITDTLVHAPVSPPGPGRLIEFKSVPRDPFSFEIEHNTVWYEFTAPANCLLEFDIIPLDSTDNYDFLLFRYYTKGTCDSIADAWIPAIRSAISENYSYGGRTGLSDTAIDLNVPEGPGYAYVRALQVQQGARYLLVLDNQKRNGSGHTIHLKYKNCGLEPGMEPTPTVGLRVFLTDTLDKPLSGEILVRQRYSRSEGPDTAIDASGHSHTGDLTQSTYYEIFAKAPGYLTYYERFRSESRRDSLIKQVKLKEIVVGSSELFDPIYFRKESDKFETGSKDALEKALKILRDNPEIKVEIQGHVSRPENIHGWIGDMEDKALGELRAKAVKDYLVKKKIDKDRIEIRNMMHTDMVNPYARNQEQMAPNRRAEIMVISVR